MTVSALRDAIKRCVSNANADAPADADLRVMAFVARLSGCMESLGDHELDAMLLGLFDQAPAARPNPPVPQRAVLLAA